MEGESERRQKDSFCRELRYKDFHPKDEHKYLGYL